MPLFGLQQTREERDKARLLLRDGADPAERRKLERLTAQIAQAATFASIADQILFKLEREQRASIARTAFNTFNTLRLRLLKIGARIREMAQRVRIAFAAACPQADLIRKLFEDLAAQKPKPLLPK